MKTLFNKRIFRIGLGLLFVMHSAHSQDRREEGNMILEDVPEVPEEIKNRIGQYQNTRSASFKDWLPNDGGIMISTRFGNTTQLHTVENPGAARKQLTYFDEPLSNGSFSSSPDYNGFLFTKDTGGDEFSQIFWYDMKTRDHSMLSDGESRNFGVLWSNKGDKFAFTSNRRNNKDFDIYISEMSAPKKAELKIDKGDGYWYAADWSPDDSKLLIVQYLSITNSNTYVLDIATKQLKPISNVSKENVFQGIAWSREGGKIYAIADEGKEFVTLLEYNLESGRTDYITNDIKWDIETLELNSKKSKAVFVANENGYNQLYKLNLLDNDYSKIDGLPKGQIGSLGFHPNKDELAMVLNTGETPGDVFSIDLSSSKLTQWTYSEVGGLDTKKFPQAELIQYPTFDKADDKTREIPAFVFRPKNATGPTPVLISIHGGPEGQYVPRFSSFNAYLANELGITIIAPNVRGSSGYGKTYVKLDNGFNREDSVKDIGALIDWIGQQPEYDSSRIAVYGGSYGGYMVLASMFKYNDKLKCGVDIVGISNFVTFLENTEEYRRDLRRVEYGDERDPKMREHLLAISPTSHVDKIKKPLFVIQGANDPRVPASESEQMVKSIRENQGKVWYMLAKDEGHGFRKKDNRNRMTEAIALFLKEHLLN